MPFLKNTVTVFQPSWIWMPSVMPVSESSLVNSVFTRMTHCLSLSRQLEFTLTYFALTITELSKKYKLCYHTMVHDTYDKNNNEEED